MNIFLALFLSFWSLGIGLLDYSLAQSALRQWAARSYATTRGTLEHCEVSTGRTSKGGEVYGINIVYRYEVGGKPYQGTRRRYESFGSSSDEDFALAYVSQHPAGSEVTVHYDAANPSEAVLDTDLEGVDLVLALFAAPFNAVAVGGWLVLLGGGNGSQGDKIVVVGRPSIFRRLHSALLSVTAGIGCLSFLAIFVVGFLIGLHPSVSTAAATWACILGTSGWLALGSLRQPLAGAVLIDRPGRCITYIESFRERRIPIADIHCVSLRPTGATVLCGPDLLVHGPAPRARAEKLARQLAEQLGVRFEPVPPEL